MSDFDKEAEREKLRKKYADDEAKRANTKRMSELLLKGATMTNQHCDECGDPLFSHDGQTFCPTCQAGTQQPADAQQQADTQQPMDTQQANGAQQPANAAQSPATEPESSATQPQSTPTDTPATNGHPGASDGRPPEPTQQSTQQSTSQSSPPTEGLTTARQSLIGTITRFSQQAAKTDDPRRAKELLAAAREAAETLRALEFE
ncbi:Sjogren's syndrome/scleroderma autoantigen 1 family protein [Halonotius roseus]|uniref:Uncharacterized protein n=1 Tax=Halonotius roseus TaxID=2511997 RepID=A0A544QP61_9EURY|nr:Sjogren's syndrome/scleroderma autoantigen 1 family protein [Halonotius roseus]TQQ80670.1 hypothetical protein EWF95_09330 [Halonotius roseus]